ncbi:response regulator transcription factor [Anaerosolibacter sp.]|uniref:response regulator transcription factor n=1 Tax=Anaerosolibacter sp. TaxID=1872527 RepID=UPI0039EF52D7
MNDRLSSREIEVLQLVADGLTDMEIGEKLFIAHKTVKNHKSHAFQKIGCHSSAHAVAYCFRNKLIK